MHIREKTKPWGQRNCRAQRQDCIEAQIWGRLQKVLLHWRFPRVASIILKRKKFGTTRTLPRAGRPAKPSNWWRRALSRLVTKKLMVTLVELHDHICIREKPTEGQTSLQHSTDLDFMAVWPNSILSSVKTHESTLGNVIYKKGPSESEKQDSLVWWTLILSIMFEGNQLCSSPAEYIPKLKCAGSSLMSWGCFSVAGTGRLVRVERKLNEAKYRDILNENLFHSA